MQSMDELDRIARRAMVEYGLEPDFSDGALRQAQRREPAPQPGDDTRDLRGLLWSSIDNDDSRDLDQLTVLVPLGSGESRVLVAIADVDWLVPIDSPVDQHARSNTTSVYTAAGIFPMLPEQLSTDRTSLNEGVERLAVVVDMTIQPDGEHGAEEVYRARVLNRAKLAYDSVAAWLEGDAPPPVRVAAVAGMAEQLQSQARVAAQMRRARQAKGALDFETVQARPVFNETTLTDMRIDKRNVAKQLIEDFMVAANGAVARYLTKIGRSSLRRVLRTPPRWDRIAAIAAQHGGSLPATPDARALGEFLAERRKSDPQGFPDLSLSFIKLLGAGEYDLDIPGEDPPGHFGLAVRDYTHSTAPNRRFPDLIVQRLLKAALASRPPPYSNEELRALAAHCTEQERDASKVERLVRKAASAFLLARRVGERFKAVVTGASEKGTWVRIDQPVAEGRVVRGFQGLDVGDQVRVELVGVNAQRGFIDFARV
jgi:VacB/RNase II family 3'-5' exoribonuclease